ncbi:hypothetical protein RhiirC2_802234, partial [Rhizophagus irregularis]
MPNKEIFVGYTFFRPEKKEKDTLMIITNNRHIVKKYDKSFKTSSDRAIMNTKYRISKYLT